MAHRDFIATGRQGTGYPVASYRIRDRAPSRSLKLIAGPQIPRSTPPLYAALSAYAEGEHRDDVRLPAGFFRSRTV